MYNSTELTLDITTTKESDFNAVQRSYIFIITTIVIAIIGLVGNVLCIVVMLNKTMRHLPFAVFSGVLAVSDSCILILSVLSSVVSLKENSQIVSYTSCGFIVFAVFFCNQFSSWVVVFLTIERMVAVLVPLKCREIVTRRRAIAILSLTGFILFGVNVHSFWTMGYSNSRCAWNEKFHKSIFYDIFVWVDAVLFFILPAAIILVLNLTIICKLWQIRKQHLSSFKKQKSAIIILFGVSIAFIVLTSPEAIRDIYQLLYRRQGQTTGWAYYVPVTLWLMNYAVNFYLYSLAGSKVRNVLILICCKSKNIRKSRNATNSNGTQF